MILSLFGIVLFLLLNCSEAKSGAAKTGKKKQATTAISDGEGNVLDISRILESTRRHTVALYDSNFTKYVKDRPRNYHAVVFLTASAKKYQCSVCKRAAKTYKEAARYYAESYSFAKADKATRIAFFILDVDTARNVFTSMNLETVPKLYVLPPTEVDAPKQSISDFEISADSTIEGLNLSFR